MDQLKGEDGKYHFVYLTTNLINGKKYLGKHSTNNIEDGYLGSGVTLKKAIKKYSKQNFKREILEFHKTDKLAWEGEKLYCKKLNVRVNKNFYNITDGGEGNNFWQNKKRSKETILKMKLNRKYAPPWNKDLPKEQQPLYGRKYSKEHCKKISESNLGKIVSKKTKENLRISHLGQKTWNKNLKGVYKASKETRMKQSKSLKGNCGKIVLQFDLKNNFIKEWECVNYTKYSVFSPSLVSRCCNNKLNKHKNFKWYFKNNTQ